MHTHWCLARRASKTGSDHSEGEPQQRARHTAGGGCKLAFGCERGARARAGFDNFGSVQYTTIGGKTPETGFASACAPNESVSVVTLETCMPQQQHQPQFDFVCRPDRVILFVGSSTTSGRSSQPVVGVGARQQVIHVRLVILMRLRIGLRGNSILCDVRPRSRTICKMQQG